MKKNVLVKVGERTETRHRIVPAIYDDNGELLADETTENYEVIVPIMQAQTVDMTKDEIAEMEAQQMETSEAVSTPAEKRELAYNTVACVEWGGDMLTVSQAAQQWAYYAAEGNAAKTDDLTALIAAAKAEIRAKYPDSTGGE